MFWKFLQNTVRKSSIYTIQMYESCAKTLFAGLFYNGLPYNRVYTRFYNTVLHAKL